MNRESAPAAPPAMRRSIGGRVSVAVAAGAAEVEAIPLARPCAVRGLTVRPPLAPPGASKRRLFSGWRRHICEPAVQARDVRHDGGEQSEENEKDPGTIQADSRVVVAVRPRVASRPPGTSRVVPGWISERVQDIVSSNIFDTRHRYASVTTSSAPTPRALAAPSRAEENEALRSLRTSLIARVRRRTPRRSRIGTPP